MNVGTPLQGPWQAKSDVSADEVRQQLDRLLAHELFRHSKRYPTFLRYIVEQTLEGSHDALKERTIGVVVFGRPPEYDTAGDPVVRNTASEVRKRIVQYYASELHKNEVAITLPVGSYIPHFQRLFGADRTPPVNPGRRWKPVAIGLTLALLATLGVLILVPFRTAPLDRFWQPLVDTSAATTIVVGPAVHDRRRESAAPGQAGLFAAPDATVLDTHAAASEAISIFDARAVARLTSYLQLRRKTVEIRTDGTTTLADLRRGPIVLVGGFNNDWTMRLTGDLRFTFERDGPHNRRIRDRQNPSLTKWSVNYASPDTALTEDYALITRMLDPSTGLPMTVLGGIARYGTIAAGEFLTDDRYMRLLDQSGPAGWEHKNIQIVLATNVVNDNSGPPRILAVHTWDSQQSPTK